MTPRQLRISRLVPSLLAKALALLALYCAVLALVPGLRFPLRHASFIISTVFLPVPANLAYAALAGVLAAGVARRKRVAFSFVVVLTGLNLLADLFVLTVIAVSPEARTSDLWPAYLSVAINALLMIGLVHFLLRARSEFYARVQRASFRKASFTLAVLAVLGVGLGYLLVTWFPGTLHGPKDRLTWSIEKVLGGAILLDFHRTGRAPFTLNLLLGLFGAVALFIALFVLFRSQRAAAVLPPKTENAIRALLARQGERDSLGYFATRRDKSAVFSAAGKSAITYRVVAGVCLASGDPIGDPEAWRPAIRDWLQMAAEHAWVPAVIGASEEGAHAYARAGLRVMELGDEAIIEVESFTVDGREMRGVRQAVNRVERAGYSVRIRRHADIPSGEMARIIDRAAAWRDTETERGFSMALGRLGDPADGRCVLVEALDADGGEAALLSFVPWGERGLSLDLMRRDRESDNGLVEFMIVKLMGQARALEVARLSLNFAVFRSTFAEGARIGAGPALRAWRSILVFFSRWWQLESLYRANAKYRPVWLPRYLCFQQTRELVRVALASAIAEGFVSSPSLPALFRRGQSGASSASGSDMAATSHDSTAGSVTAEAFRERVIPVAPERHGGEQPEQVRIRVNKYHRMREAGLDPYPVGFAVTDDCLEIRKRYQALTPDVRTGESVRLAGRVLQIRDHGGVCFATIRDSSGDIQLLLTKDIGADSLSRWRSDVDIGDHIGVVGEVGTSRRGELSILLESWVMTAKCLHPLPDKRLGLTDPETQVRQRYLDLAVRAGARETLRVRSAAIHSLRESLVRRDFLEVETPILQPVHGGANARPFVTHINAYDARLYLRIAPELYLKRLCIGGVGKVFELGRTFRNEGVSYKHNPEFSMLEAYQVYADYDVMRRLAQSLIQDAATAAYGSPVLRRRAAGGKVTEVDVSGDWPVVTVNDAISAAADEKVTANTTVAELLALAQRLDVPHDSSWSRGALIVELYERLVEAKTTTPTFYKDFPTEVSPLTRQHRDDPRLAERWDLVAFGAEVGTAYSELVDPIEQRRRLTEQSLLAAGGDPEAMELDEEFLTALEYGMPPSGGLGLGVDRLIMLLTGLSIRQTLPFPLVRPVGAR